MKIRIELENEIKEKIKRKYIQFFPAEYKTIDTFFDAEESKCNKSGSFTSRSKEDHTEFCMDFNTKYLSTLLDKYLNLLDNVVMVVRPMITLVKATILPALDDIEKLKAEVDKYDPSELDYIYSVVCDEDGENATIEVAGIYEYNDIRKIVKAAKISPDGKLKEVPPIFCDMKVDEFEPSTLKEFKRQVSNLPIGQDILDWIDK